MKSDDEALSKLAEAIGLEPEGEPTVISGSIGPDGKLTFGPDVPEDIAEQLAQQLPPEVQAAIERELKMRSVQDMVTRHGQDMANHLVHRAADDEDNTVVKINALAEFLNAQNWPLKDQMFVLANQVAMACMVPLNMENDAGQTAPRILQAQVNAACFATLIARGIRAFIEDENEGGPAVVQTYDDDIGPTKGRA